VVTNHVFSRMVITVVLGCVSMVARAEAQMNSQHIKGFQVVFPAGANNNTGLGMWGQELSVARPCT
jgi:hypothetical protein